MVYELRNHPLELSGVVIDKVVWSRPKAHGSQPDVTVTIKVPGDHTENVKRLLDFAEAGPLTWTVVPEYVGPPRGDATNGKGAGGH